VRPVETMVSVADLKAVLDESTYLLSALEALSQYTHEITDEGRNLEDPDDIEDYGRLRKQVAAAIAKARGR
jgi:hypothetical protein